MGSSVRTSLLRRLFVLGVAILSALVFFSQASAQPKTQKKLKLKKTERLVTLLQTNDIHGGVEPQFMRGQKVGGMAYWVGVIRAIKRGLKARYNNRAGVLVLDGGDQFQGTLLSNFDEGQLVYRAMNTAGYDAIVPGNHAYDFGPIGWLDDRVNANNPDKDPRGALKRLVKLAKFPLVAANVYFKSSLKDFSGRKLNLKNRKDERKVDWAVATRPGFVKPYVVKRVAGLNVALIGIENARTSTMTTPENVSDLYFRDEESAYLEVREELEDQADVFVLLIHRGNAKKDHSVSQLVERLTLKSKYVDAVIAGHTHYVNRQWINGVPIVQSGYGGKQFGRIDLIWDDEWGEIRPMRSRLFGGLKLYHKSCDPNARAFCEVVVRVNKGKEREVVEYEGVIANESPTVAKNIRKLRKTLAPIAKRKIGTAGKVIKRHRYVESPLSNAMTDVLRELSSADVAFMNTGGLRATLPQGSLTYEDLFVVLPFSNHGIVIGPMEPEILIKLLKRSVKSCGAYSALMQSGLWVQYRSNCKDSNTGKDPKAKLVRVELLDGTLVYTAKDGLLTDEPFNVATFDFLADGGSGYSDFIGIPWKKDLGILREAITNRLLKRPLDFPTGTDGRWEQLNVSSLEDPVAPEEEDLGVDCSHYQ